MYRAVLKGKKDCCELVAVKTLKGKFRIIRLPLRHAKTIRVVYSL